MSTPNTLSTNDHQQLTALLAAFPGQPNLTSLPDCSTYATYRPILLAAIPLLAHLPIYGSKISAAITFLMQLADGVCGVSTSPADFPAAQAGTISIVKTAANELRVVFPQGTTINSNNISETDLYLALSRNLLAAPNVLQDGTCIIDI